jgi:hypothetical protein
MEDVIQNADGTRTLAAGKTLMAIIGAIQAEPGISRPELAKALAAQGIEVKQGTLDHHVERLHLRFAVAQKPSTKPWTGRGRAPLGLHWMGAYQVVDADALAEQRALEKAQSTGAPRIRSSMTAEECLAKAEQLEGEATAMWQGYNFSAVAPKSAFVDFSDKVRAKVERAAGLRFRAGNILPMLSSMEFAPEPEPVAAPATEATPATAEVSPEPAPAAAQDVPATEAAPVEGAAPSKPKRRK